MINVEKREEIRRAFYVEGKKIRQIGRELGISRRTVRKALKSDGSMKYTLKEPRVAPVLGPYKAQIDELLTKNKSLPPKQQYTSPTIYAAIYAQGYRGATSSLRHYIGQKRKELRQPKLFLPLEFDPGSDAQVDWGEADVILAGKQQTVQLLVVRLCYSRRIFVMAFPSQKQESFFLGQVRAFYHFGGVPHRLTYDNLKTAVYKVLTGSKREEQEQFILFRSHYLFASHYCTPGAGHEKGGVEHGVGYARRQFLVPLPVVASWADLNEWLLKQCLADDERQVRGQKVAIKAAWQMEQPHLRPLPERDWPCYAVRLAKLTPYSQVIVETNRYSAPVEQAADTLTVHLHPFRIEVFRQGESQPIATHPRYYQREQEIFDPLHYLPLLEQRPGAFHHAKPLRRWREEWPPVYEELLARLQTEQPDGVGIRTFVRILKLHQAYPAALLEQAVAQALRYGTLHADGVLLCLHQLNPPVPQPTLDLTMQPHLHQVGNQTVNLSQYNQLLEVAHVA
ncbi:MAG: IS21 family transposase [Chloroflexi bacterium]|nr:IS21 family transposase [Chloroflexota bacterium]